MTRVRILVSRVRALFRARQLDRDLEDEIASHLAEATDEYIQQGLSHDEARAAALRRFGGVSQTKEIYREVRSFMWLDDLRQDLRHTSRTLSTRPRAADTRSFLVVVLCVLALFVACHDGGPTRPTEPPPSPVVEVITVGEHVRRRFTGRTWSFDVAAPKKGTLVTALTWDGTTNGTVLLLQLNDIQFRPAAPGRFPNHLIARVKVAAGQIVRIAVLGGGTDVVYDDPFTLATALD